MGMYTELVCAFQLDDDTPENVIGILKYMTGQEDDLEVQELPDHSLFQEGSRWRFMLQSDSYYFDGTTHSNLKTDLLYPDKPSYYLTVRCNLKNYNDEIENFIDWIKTYIDKYMKGDMFIGYKRYEEDKEPTLIYI